MIKWTIVLALIWFIFWLIFRNRCEHKWRKVCNEKYLSIGVRDKYRDIYVCDDCGKVKYE